MIAHMVDVIPAHTTAVLMGPGDRYCFAKCSCGWSSPIYRTKNYAITRGKEHELAVCNKWMCWL